MKKFPLWKLISLFFILVLISLFVIACLPGSKKDEGLRSLCENLRTSYDSHLTFVIRTGGENIEGTARLSRDGAISTLQILSPEPYSDLCVEYDISGAPSGISVHFSGIDTTLPASALARINTIASLCADDYLTLLRNVPKDNISEITDTNGELFSVNFPYKNADTCLTFDGTSYYPLAFEYTDNDICASVVFEKFKLDIEKL